jgi:flagellin-like hook-associated protein FlgL
VQSILSSVIAQANTSFQGVYVFGGSDSTTPPFVSASTTYTSSQGSNASPLAATTALTAGSVTTISDATTGEYDDLSSSKPATPLLPCKSAIASAVSAGTLSAGTSATINAERPTVDWNKLGNGRNRGQLQ